jgi:hypothetical protein
MSSIVVSDQLVWGRGVGFRCAAQCWWQVLVVGRVGLGVSGYSRVRGKGMAQCKAWLRKVTSNILHIQ